MSHSSENTVMRLDKWLWASRFFKTRAIARKAIEGGKIHHNGQRAKPARTVRPGDSIRIHKADGEYHVDVLALCPQRRPAKEARQLYAETADSLASRQLARQQRQLKIFQAPHPEHRPTKRQRRQLRALSQRQQDE